MVCVLFLGGGYWTRVWEFALNIHAYVSYLAATTKLLRENWPWVTPTLQTSKGEKRREQTRHSTKPTNWIQVLSSPVSEITLSNGSYLTNVAQVQLDLGRWSSEVGRNMQKTILWLVPTECPDRYQLIGWWDGWLIGIFISKHSVPGWLTAITGNCRSFQHLTGSSTFVWSDLNWSSRLSTGSDSPIRTVDLITPLSFQTCERVSSVPQHLQGAASCL